MIPVDVYRNLHTGGFSVRNRRTGRVIVSDAAYVLVKNATFVVQKRGNEIARDCAEKTVHAFVRGELESFNVKRGRCQGAHPVTYNPKRHETFVLKHREHVRVRSAEYAECIVFTGGSDVVHRDSQVTVYIPCTAVSVTDCVYER